MKIGVLQLQSVDDLQLNLAQIFSLLNEGLKDPSIRIYFLPENALFFRLKEGAELPHYQLTDSFFQQLQTWVDQHDRAIHIGSLPLVLDGTLFNSSVLIRKGQALSAGYQKIHLFDIQLSGDKAIRESDRFGRGSNPHFFEYEGFRFAESICYDLRFSNLYEIYAKQAVDVILIPSAFLVKTGQAHWHILNRARAIESQCYVVSAAQAGQHRNPSSSSPEAYRETYGHSLVVGPWGQVVAEGSAHSPELLVAELQRSEIETVRKQIPQLSHRRTIKN